MEVMHWPVPLPDPKTVCPGNRALQVLMRLRDGFGQTKPPSQPRRNRRRQSASRTMRVSRLAPGGRELGHDTGRINQQIMADISAAMTPFIRTDPALNPHKANPCVII